jgi:beta-N-acetylhexosaminidase
MTLCALIWLVGCAGQTTRDTRQGPLAPYAAPPALQGRAAAMDPNAAIDRIISKMTLDQQIGQMLMIEFYLPGSPNSYMAATLRQSHAGGVIIYNIDKQNNDVPIPATAAAFRTVADALQADADQPLLIALDQEGGDVNRLAPYFGAAPSASQLGRAGDLGKIQAEGALDAQRLAQIGVNVDLAPDVDVSDGIGGGVDLLRMWSTDPNTVATDAGAYLDGLQHAGIMGSLKHWPGIGAVHSDPHFSLPVLDRTVDQLQAKDFVPFKTLLAHGPAMVMTTHVIVTQVDPGVPTTLSPKLVQGTLRDQLGFQGVIITDQLHMDGILQYMSSVGVTDYGAALDEAAVRAILAGNDILEGAFGEQSAVSMLNAIHHAVATGRITQQRIEDSDRRILRLKWAYGVGLDRLMQAAGPDPLPPTGASATLPNAAPVADVTPHWAA